MDAALQEKLRAATTPDEQVELCGALKRFPEHHPTARQVLQRLVRQDDMARELFLELLPEEACAFCILCREPFELNDDGYPVGAKPGKPRKKRKHCTSCQEQVSNAFRMANVLRVEPSTYAPVVQAYTPNYCGKCGRAWKDGHPCKLPIELVP